MKMCLKCNSLSPQNRDVCLAGHNILYTPWGIIAQNKKILFANIAYMFCVEQNLPKEVEDKMLDFYRNSPLLIHLPLKYKRVCVSMALAMDAYGYSVIRQQVIYRGLLYRNIHRVHRIIRKVKHSLGMPCHPALRACVQDIIYRIPAAPPIKDEIRESALVYVDRIEKEGLLAVWGMRPSVIAATVIYIVGQSRKDNLLTQLLLSEITPVCGVTLRAAYKKVSATLEVEK